MSSKDTTLLIDGDLILYRSCVAVEHDVQWDPENHMLYSNFEDAWLNIEQALNTLFERFGTKKHLIAITEGKCFRYGLTPSYKANRAGGRKPLCFSRAKQVLKERYKVYSHEGLEADDVLGIFGSRDPKSIVCSADKDLKTVPCTLFDGKEVQRIEEVYADYWHMYQTLIGDTSDGYPGCPGIGDKKARAILDKEPTEDEGATTTVGIMWDRVVAAFTKAGLTEDDAILQARLARILRSGDWDDQAQQPILWSPK